MEARLIATSSEPAPAFSGCARAFGVSERPKVQSDSECSGYENGALVDPEQHARAGMFQARIGPAILDAVDWPHGGTYADGIALEAQGRCSGGQGKVSSAAVRRPNRIALDRR
jgi:hypothetical protein